MVMKKKVQEMDKLFHGRDAKSDAFNYKKVWGLKPFKGSHPKIMKEWIDKNKNDIDLLSIKPEIDFKNIRLAISDLFEAYTNIRIGEYKNYILKH